MSRSAPRADDRLSPDHVERIQAEELSAAPRPRRLRAADIITVTSR